MWSFTAIESFCLQPRSFSVVWMPTCEQELDLFEIPAIRRDLAIPRTKVGLERAGPVGLEHGGKLSDYVKRGRR